MTSTVKSRIDRLRNRNQRRHTDKHMGQCDLVPFLSAKKGKRPHPGTQILSQIPEDGDGNRGQMIMPHIYLGSPPLGLNIDTCIRVTLLVKFSAGSFDVLLSGYRIFCQPRENHVAFGCLMGLVLYHALCIVFLFSFHHYA